MNNAAAIAAVNHALAHYCCRQAYALNHHSAREIVQMSMLAEYLHEPTRPAPPTTVLSSSRKNRDD